MWYHYTTIYQIYPLGFCAAERENSGGKREPRIRKVLDWIPHLQTLHAETILFNPLFESDAHGYDTRDLRHLDRRLGSDDDLRFVCETLREAGFRILFDGVFNHVGRGFFAFQDLLEKRENSAYKDWFYIDFSNNNAYNDGLSYQGWEGHYNLVKLNLQNPEVRRYIFDAVAEWMDVYKISGLRLDVAYTLDQDFLRALHAFCLEKDPEFLLIGEMITGDYNHLLGEGLCHSVTNYECAKGTLSAFNSHNLFEIAHSLQRQFNDEPWALYHGVKTLLSFLDNHDTDRAASVLQNKKHLPLAYVLMFTQPGIPCVYYGSEWGAEGRRGPDSDWAVRPAYEHPEENSLTELIARLNEIRRKHPALAEGEYRTVHLNNEQFIFERKSPDERILVAVNCADAPVTVHFDAGCGESEELLSGKTHDFGGGSELAPCSAEIWRMEK